MQLTGKVAVISGGGSGIGQATALLLAQEGAKVATIDRTLEHGTQTVEKIQQQGGEALVTVADISQPEQVKHAYEKISDRWGRVDIVFANAGINGVWASLEELSPEDWDRTLAVNLKGTFLTVKYALPYLKKQGGSIVVNASVNGTRVFSNTGATAYAASKAAQVAFAKMIAVELAQDKIRVNVICPGEIETNIGDSTQSKDLKEIQIPVEYPEGRIPLTGKESGKALQVAQVVLFLISDAASHVTGTELWIDGGESLVQG